MTPSSSSPGDRPPAWPAAPPLLRERDGTSPLERLALAQLRRDVASMPPSDVVQLVLWPETIAHWARDAGVATAVAYNMLSRFKPYRRVRELLAHRLDAPSFVLDHLIDAPRPLPAAQRAPLPDATDAPAPPPPVPPARISPTVRLPSVRDGTNPIEQRALWQTWQHVAALPASLVVQLAIYPETLAEWARRREVPASMLYAMLAGTQPHPGLREALARRLNVARGALDALLDAPRREMLTPRPPQPDAMPALEAAAPVREPREPPSPAGDGPRSDDVPGELPGQLSLGL